MRVAVAALLLSLGLSLCGCQMWQRMRGDGFAEDEQKESKLMGRMRGPDLEHLFWSPTTKGQEIERSLGVTK